MEMKQEDYSEKYRRRMFELIDKIYQYSVYN